MQLVFLALVQPGAATPGYISYSSQWFDARMGTECRSGLVPRLLEVCDLPLGPVMNADKAGHPAPHGITPRR